MHQKSIFCFRQDLRTHDNRGLIECIRNSHEILPIFILDDNLISGFGGLSDQKFSFLREMLDNLSKELVLLGGVELSVFYGKPEEIIPELARKHNIEAVYCNRSYGRYGMKRDKALMDILALENIILYRSSDYLIAEPEDIAVRKVFTPYFRLWKQFLELRADRVQVMETPSFLGISIPEGRGAAEYIPGEKHPYFTLAFGQARLDKYIRVDYDDTRNRLDTDGTSKLAPYLRFGVFSIREIYARAKSVSEVFVSELVWREFWQHIAYHFPETKTVEFQENKRHIKWDTTNELFDAWCRGETGYPIVDASMKQLLETNWMHGRARMVVASFLTKDLHIDWRLGEAFFKKHLLDYDENVNFGNWQWSASVGADPKPLRIFNPSLQSEKFDPEGKFIRRYIPSLSSELIPSIHDPLDNNLAYIAPIVDHKIEQKRARELYRRPE